MSRPQTIYGELISLESNNDALGLAVFVLQRLLWNPDIAAEFRHAKVPHLYKDGKQYDQIFNNDVLRAEKDCDGNVREKRQLKNTFYCLQNFILFSGRKTTVDIVYVPLVL